MSITKTRQRLLEVARELFAHKGLEATTMNDIALASGRGRRTLYTYFRNIWMVEKVRKAFDEEEHRVLLSVLQEGVDKGQFRIENVGLMADIIHYSVKGLEVPYIYDRLGEGLTEDETYPIVKGIVARVLNIPESVAH